MGDDADDDDVDRLRSEDYVDEIDGRRTKCHQSSKGDDTMTTTWKGKGHCDSTVKTGKRAGQICNNEIDDNVVKCHFHKPRTEKSGGGEEKKDVKTCKSKIKSGKRKDEICGKPVVEDGDTCLFHKPKPKEWKGKGFCNGVVRTGLRVGQSCNTGVDASDEKCKFHKVKKEEKKKKTKKEKGDIEESMAKLTIKSDDDESSTEYKWVWKGPGFCPCIRKSGALEGVCNSKAPEGGTCFPHRQCVGMARADEKVDMKKRFVGHVYCLLLEGDNIYVGHTIQTITERFDEHVKGGDMCAKWTKLHKPIKVLFDLDGDTDLENQVTLALIKICGPEKVRGGKYCQVGRSSSLPLGILSVSKELEELLRGKMPKHLLI